MSRFFASIIGRRSGRVYTPANSSELAAIGSPPAGSTILLKSGVTYTAPSMPIIAADKVALGVSGTGSKPILSGAAIQASWTYDAGNNVYYTSAYPTGLVGLVLEDGVPMKFRRWQTAGLAATASGMNSSVSAGYYAGGFAFNPATRVLYIRPSSGTAASHTYTVSSAAGQVYGEGLSITGSTTPLQDITIDSIRFENVIRHAIFAVSVTRLRIAHCEAQYVGPWYPSTTLDDANLNLVHGNGIEFGHACSQCVVDDFKAYDIFDSVMTCQTGAGSAQVSDHLTFANVDGRRHGMHFAELSIFSANQQITDVLVTDSTSTDQGIGWSGERNGGGLNIYNGNFPASSSMTRIFGHNITANRIYRLYGGFYHKGVCGIQQSSCSSCTEGYNAGQYSGVGTDYYRAISSPLGPWGTMTATSLDLRTLLA